MLILQRYLFREVAQAFGAVLAVLLLVFLSHRFVRFLTEAAAGQISADLIFVLLALKVAVKLSVLLPLALYIGVLLGLGRMHKDSEIIAMSAASAAAIKPSANGKKASEATTDSSKSSSDLCPF